MKTLSDLYLEYQCVIGWGEKVAGKIPKEKHKEYADRLNFELETLSKAGISDYFLVLQGVIKFCRENKIPVGAGRGSAAGSLVAYLIGLTMPDPIEYGLLFERFYNPGRAETRALPDIDQDVSEVYREKIINDYIIPKYGEDKVAPIIAFGTLQPKGLIKDIGRVLMIPLSVCEIISGLIDVKRGISRNVKETLEDKNEDGTYTRNAILMRDYKKDYPELFKWIEDLEDQNISRTKSVHAAGIIIAPEPLSNIIPMEWNAKKGLACTAYDMYNLEDTGLLKLDLLGLRTVDVLYNTMKILKPDCDYLDELKKIPMDDKYIYDQLSHGKSVGIFQFESPFMSKILTDVKPDNVEDLSTINALGRPGPLDAKIDITNDIIFNEDGSLPDFLAKKFKKYNGDNISLNMIEVFAARRAGALRITYLHPKLEPILKNTLGIICFQEQIMQICSQLAGFTLAEADNTRKIMGKKLLDKIAGEKPKFISGCIKNGIDENIAEEIWKQCETFAAYGFNKCLHPDTEILLSDGRTKKISEIYNSDYKNLQVISYSDKGKCVHRSILDVQLSKVDQCYKIKLENGAEIRVTENHKFQTSQGLKKCSELTKDMWLRVPRQININTDEKEHKLDYIVFLSFKLAGKLKIVNNKIKFTTEKDKIDFFAQTSSYKEDDIWHDKFIDDLCESIKTFNIDSIILLLSILVNSKSKSNDFYIPYSYENKAVLNLISFLLKRLGIYNETLEKGVAVYDIKRFKEKIAILAGKTERIKEIHNRKKIPRNLFEMLIGSAKSKKFNLRILADMFNLEYTEIRRGQLYYSQFLAMCEFLGSKEPRKIIDADYYYSSIRSIKKDGDPIETYDIEIDDTHNFVGDGIITENSHSIAYSFLSYYTAYYKFRHPAEFMSALISSKNDIEARKLWLNDAAESLGLKITPPDINRSERHFTSAPNEILFGINEIKGIGERSIGHLLTERSKGKFKDIKDFYKRVDLGMIDAGVMKALICAGAFDCFKINRTTLLENDPDIRKNRVKAINAGKPDETIIKIKDQIDFLKSFLFKEHNTCEHLKGVVPKKYWKNNTPKSATDEYIKILESKIDDKNKKNGDKSDPDYWFKDWRVVENENFVELLSMEESVLGMSVSGTLATPYKKIIQMHGHNTVKDIKADIDSKFFDSCGVIYDIKIHSVKSGKNKGKPMAFAKFVDLTGSIDITIFPDKFEKFHNSIISNKLVKLSMSKMDDGKLCVNKLSDIGAVYG